MADFSQKISFVVIVVMSILLFFLILKSENGLMDFFDLKSEIKIIETKNNQLKEKNIELARKIERLKHDMKYIEHIARHELGMAADDELVIRPKIEKKQND
ncbi:MAG: hypothetical protein B6I26_06970 [Desulfobacteraceae bacterium 4572_130]|nr:MAG: hypothetical protein B6I26_06970 [Desulfobacteraceae bacterium 4572_130]